MDVRALKRAEAATKRANDLAALYSSDDLTGAPLTEAEKAEGEAARKTAVSLVGSAIRVVRAHLAEIEEKGTPKKKKTKQDEDMEFTVKANIPVATPVSNNIEIPASASDLEGVNQTVEEMFDGAKDVIKDFDKVLEFPSLQGVTATLDTVPVIGIRGRKLMYTKHTVVDGNASSAFEEFDDLPHDAPEDISTARVFPFNGHLFLFIGTAVWKKEHRFTGSDELVDTVDKWPKMYQEGWFKIGDNVFSADIVDASFYGELTDPTDVNSAPITRILLLDSAGQLHAFGGDLQTSADAKNFVPVGFVPSDGVPDAPPAWTKIAYSRGVMHAFADGDIWQLDMKLTETSGQYTIQDRVTVGQVLEMEGNEIGLVLRRDDGFLYQQYIEMADSEKSPANAFLYEHPEAATADPALVELAYKKWVSIPSDLRMIGVASPGVGLDLMVLTSAHRDRYLRTQTVLYPVVEKIRTFAEVHSSYLEYLQTEADKYSIDSPPPDEVAIAHAQNYIAHIGFWSGFINDTTTGVKGTVNSMSADAGKVTEQLKIQLSNIEVQLEVMEANLDILEEAKDTARLMIIAGIVVALGGVLALLGIAYTNGPFLSPAGAAGGLLLVTGDAIAAFGFKTLIEINEDIARVEAGIGDLTAASMRYQAISEQYDGIDTAYEALDTFWGLMFNDVRQRELISVDSFQAMGASLLLQHQSFSIDAAQAAVDKLVGGCTAYLDLLNSQGVQVGTTARSAPTRRTVFVGDWAKEDAFNARATKLGPISQADVKSDTADFSRAASYGEQLLKNGDVAAYLKHLELEIVPRGRVAATVLDGEVVRVRV